MHYLNVHLFISSTNVGSEYGFMSNTPMHKHISMLDQQG